MYYNVLYNFSVQRSKTLVCEFKPSKLPWKTLVCSCCEHKIALTSIPCFHSRWRQGRAVWGKLTARGRRRRLGDLLTCLLKANMTQDWRCHGLVILGSHHIFAIRLFPARPF